MLSGAAREDRWLRSACSLGSVCPQKTEDAPEALKKLPLALKWRNLIMPELSRFFDTLVHGYDRTVGFPLFRILALCVVIPSVFQLIFWEIPTSISSVTPRWYDPVFIVMQIAGALFVLIALALGDTRPSAMLERPGDILLACTGGIYFLGVWVSNDWSLPLTVASWLQLGLSVFCVIRVFQINRQLDENEKVVKREKDQGRVIE